MTREELEKMKPGDTVAYCLAGAKRMVMTLTKVHERHSAMSRRDAECSYIDGRDRIVHDNFHACELQKC